MKTVGVGHRKNGQLYLSMRCNTPRGSVRIFLSSFKTKEVGALFHDFARRYSEMQMKGVGKGGRLTDEVLNYPEASRSLPPLPSDFDLWNNKKNGIDFILNVATTAAAAANLLESPRRSTMAVGDPSSSNRSSSHQNVYRKSSYVSEGKQDLFTIEVLETLLETNKRIDECIRSLYSKLEERQKLETMVAGIEEGSGFIILDPGPETFHHDAAFLTLPLENFQQAYKSEESKCSMLRKKVEDHNLKAIDATLMSPENRMAGRQRSSENERLAHVPELCPHEVGVPVGGSETCGYPASPPAIVTPGGTHTTMAPVEMDTSLLVVPLKPTTIAVDPPDFTECREGISEMIEELRSPTIAGSPNWSHMFETGQGEFRLFEDL